MCDHPRTYDLMDDKQGGWQAPEAVRGFYARSERDDNFTRACIVAILALAIGAGVTVWKMPERTATQVEMMP